MTVNNNNSSNNNNNNKSREDGNDAPIVSQQNDLEQGVPETDHHYHNQDKDLGLPKSPSVFTLTDTFVTLFKLPTPFLIWMHILFAGQLVLPCFILYDRFGVLAIICASVQISVAFPLVIYYIHGLSKSIAIVHVLLGMPIVVVYGIMRLTGTANPQISPGDDIKLFVVSLLIVVILGISLIFDFIDIYRYIVLGNRDLYTTTGLIRRNVNDDEQNDNKNEADI